MVPNRSNLTDEVWSLAERCWAQDPRTRPDFTEIVGILDMMQGSRRAASDSSGARTSMILTTSPQQRQTPLQPRSPHSPRPNPLALTRSDRSISNAQPVSENGKPRPPPVITRGSDGSPKMIESVDGDVQAGTPRALVKRLIASDTIGLHFLCFAGKRETHIGQTDSTFNTTFLLTMPTFISVADLIDILISRFDQHGSIGAKTSGSIRSRCMGLKKSQ